MKKNIFVALDFNSLEKALDVTSKVKDQIAGVKIGTELYAICGTEGLKKFDEFNIPIFLDLKLNDIPNQVKKTVMALSSTKSIKHLTLHTMGSLEMLRAAQDVSGSIELLGVTILTSWDKKNLQSIGLNNSLSDQIKLLVNTAIDAKLPGIISSAQDIPLVRSISKDLKIFCPGIRESSSKQDQK